MKPSPTPWLQDVPLGPRTTMGTGGSAERLLYWHDTEELHEGLRRARDSGWATWLLGGGSNVLIADAGLPGLVLVPRGGGIRVMAMGPDTWEVQVDAGVVWDDLVAWSVARGLGGLECLSGIPGLVGSAPIQNIGAYGQEVAQVITAVEELDTGTLATRHRGVADCRFAYRDSAWKREPGRAIVTRVHMRLGVGAAPCTTYAQVADALSGASLARGKSGLHAVRETVLALRRAKGMVVDPSDPDSRSCGSFFVNPVIQQDAPDAAAWTARVRAKEAPGWPQPDGSMKLSAAWLIEHSGMARGYGDGPVGLSTKHTLALVNRGGATTAQVFAFGTEVTRRVAESWGVALAREPVLLGSNPE